MRKLLVITLSLLFSFPAISKHKLRLNLEVGKEYFQNYSSTSKINQQIQGQNIDMDMIVSGKMKYTVKQKHKEYYQMDVKYENLTMKMQTPYGLMEFSTEKDDPNDILSKMLTSMTKHSFSC